MPPGITGLVGTLYPAAVHALVDVHETPSSVLLPVPTLGVGTIDQVDPSQDSTSVWSTPLPLWK